MGQMQPYVFPFVVLIYLFINEHVLLFPTLMKENHITDPRYDLSHSDGWSAQG